MRIVKGDLWNYHRMGAPITITTNGMVKKNGEAVMGAGIAKQAARFFPEMPALLGEHILTNGNVVGWFPEQRLLTFPVKHHWAEDADLELIGKSAWDFRFTAIEVLNMEVGELCALIRIPLPKPGCGNGKLTWQQVKPVLQDNWVGVHEKFVIVDKMGEGDSPIKY